MIFNRVRIASPCMGCENRHFKCHSECEKYLSYRAKLDALRCNIQAEIAKENKAEEHFIETGKRLRKGKK